MAKHTLSVTFIKNITLPKEHAVLYFDDHKDAPKGFALKVSATGRKNWVLRYYVNNKPRRVTLKQGFPTWGPKKARIEANNLKTRIISGEDILAEREALKQAKLAAEIAETAKAKFTLGALATAYVEQLRRDGKSSARAIENCFKKNIEMAFPKLWATPAENLDVEDFLVIVAALTDAGKLREAAKLRSYLRAAYTVAVRARTDPRATKAMRQFKLTRNPVSDLAPIVGSIQARDRALSLLELRLYYQRITALPAPAGSVLAFHLLTGGQRLEQLFRLTDKDLDGDTITLYDNKGRRLTPRPHVVPLLPEAKKALKAMGKGPYLVSFHGGSKPATDSAFRSRVKTVCAAMLKAEEVTEPFTPGDIRRTVETRLTEAGVTSDQLAQLLSHGLGGVQNRHYQKYKFMPEKLAALEKLHDLLTAPSGDVVPMKWRAKT
jgi:integrase